MCSLPCHLIIGVVAKNIKQNKELLDYWFLQLIESAIIRCKASLWFTFFPVGVSQNKVLLDLRWKKAIDQCTIPKLYKMFWHS